MGKIYSITEETLKSWLTDLEYFNVDDVKKEIREMLQSIGVNPATSTTSDEEAGGLKFHEITIGETYQFRPLTHTKKSLHYKKVKVIDKKLKNVTGELEGTGKRYSIPPETLERVTK